MQIILGHYETERLLAKVSSSIAVLMELGLTDDKANELAKKLVIAVKDCPTTAQFAFDFEEICKYL